MLNGLDRFRGEFAASNGQSTFLSVAAAASGDEEAHQLFTAQVLQPIESKFRTSLDSTDSDPAGASFAFDVLLGTMIHRLVIRQLPLDDEFERRFLALTRYVTGAADPHLDPRGFGVLTPRLTQDVTDLAQRDLLPGRRDHDRDHVRVRTRGIVQG